MADNFQTIPVQGVINVNSAVSAAFVSALIACLPPTIEFDPDEMDADHPIINLPTQRVIEVCGSLPEGEYHSVLSTHGQGYDWFIFLLGGSDDCGPAAFLGRVKQ